MTGPSRAGPGSIPPLYTLVRKQFGHKSCLRRSGDSVFWLPAGPRAVDSIDRKTNDPELPTPAAPQTRPRPPSCLVLIQELLNHIYCPAFSCFCSERVHRSPWRPGRSGPEPEPEPETRTTISSLL